MRTPVVASPPCSPPRCAVEERELRVIAREVLGEAVVLGQAARQFRGHCISAACWRTDRALFARCVLDGLVHHVVLDANARQINDLRAACRFGKGHPGRSQHEPPFVFPERVAST
jgi:hypothetical protein